MSTPKTTQLISRLSELDLSGCLYFNRYCRQTTVHQSFSIISRLGDGVFWYSLAAVLPLLYGWQGLFATLEFALIGLCCLAIYKTLKGRFYRARPFVRSKKVFKIFRGARGGKRCSATNNGQSNANVGLNFLSEGGSQPDNGD